jgi:lysophospholipase L1-like esterase
VAFAGVVPYEKNFTTLLESALTAALGKKVAVWNAAGPGYNTEQERILLKTIGPTVAPDLVLVQFCLNDYLDPPVLASSGDLDVTRFDERRGVRLRGLLYRSRALFFLKERFKDLQKLYPNLFPTWMHYIHHVHEQPGWQRAKEALVHLRTVARRLGANVLLVIFPVEQQLRIEDRAPQEDLVAFAREHEMPVIDLFEPFRREWRKGLFIDYSKRLGSADKLHLSEKGHALAARVIGQYLESEGHRLLGEKR